MTNHLGRNLDSTEIVHHINKDITDNRIENLKIFKSQGEHVSQHNKERKHEPLEILPGADRPVGQVFATAEDKYKTAAAAFEGLTRRLGSSKGGEGAAYYAALSRLELGQSAEAEKALQELAGKGAGLEPELARYALADLYRRSGKVDKAVEAYRGLVTNPVATVPRDHALISAARALEEARRWSDAADAYRQVSEEFPASLYAAEARSRVEYLRSAEQG